MEKRIFREVKSDSNAARGIRLDHLTGARFFAALLVFFSHLNWASAPAFWQAFCKQGYVGVNFFFLLSGFVLAYSYRERFRSRELSKSTFFLLRVVRLAPLHYLTAIPFLVLLLSNRDEVWPALTNLLFLQSWVPDSAYYFSLNSPSWSLSDEMFFYFIFMWGALFNTRQLIVVGGLLVLVVSTSALIWSIGPIEIHLAGGRPLSHWLFYICPAFRLLEFVLGMLIYDLWQKDFFKTWRCTYLALPLLTLAMVCAQWVPEAFRYSLYYLPFVAFLLISQLTNRSNLGPRLLASPSLVLLGESSFAFYLIHQPVINLAKRVFPDSLHYPFLNAAVLLLILTFASILMFRFVERPIDRYLRARVLTRSN